MQGPPAAGPHEATHARSAEPGAAPPGQCRVAPPAATIRTATPADLPELQRIYRAASLSNAGDAPLLLARPEHLVLGDENVLAGRTRIAVADGPDGTALGFATLVPGPDGTLELEDLFVDPPAQRRGIARRLVADAVGLARPAGCPRIGVTGNPHAEAFYVAVGFVTDHRVATPLGEGLRMHLDVG